MNTEEKDNPNFIINNVYKWPLVVWVIFSFLVFIGGWRSLQIAVLSPSTFFLLIFIKERWRRKKEGYYVDWQVTSSEDGCVKYFEGGKTVELYVYLYDNNAYDPIIYVPSNDRWEEIMPDWAKYRKEEIMGRVRKHIKKWKYEETDNKYRMYPQRP